MQQLTVEKIGLKFIITLSERMTTCPLFLPTQMYLVQAAAYVIEGGMFPALQFLCHLK